jgi:hypothetical protein
MPISRRMLTRAHCGTVLRCGVLCVLSAILGMESRSTGETFVLSTGGRLDAQPLNPQRGPSEPYQIRTDVGVRLGLAPQQVHRVVVKSEVQKQYDAMLPTLDPTAAGHLEMAEWCREAGLLDERRKHLAQVILLDENHADARKALGYMAVGSRWMTGDELMRNQGYVRSGGGWKSPQQIELETAARERELGEKALRRDILIWIDQLNTKRGSEAHRTLQELRDPLAASGLAEVVMDTKQPLKVRKLCLEVLGRLPPGLATSSLIKLAMDEKDENLRDMAIDELVRGGVQHVAPYFIGQLGSKDNKRVNRAAYCLGRLGDKEATLPLIKALVTTHEFIIPPAGGGGINFNSSGGLSMGGKPKRVKDDKKNDSVRHALVTLHPNVNLQHDESAWERWYVETFTSTTIDLRRDE